MQKPLATGAAFLIAALGGSPASAADQVQYQILGTLAQACSVTAPDTQTFNPGSTALQPIGFPSYQCNFAGNAALRFWTLNGGQIVSSAAASNNNVAQSRAYTFVFDGTNLGQLTSDSASATAVTRPIVAPNVAQNGAATMQLASGVTVAGSYADIIFISIAP